MQSLSRGLPQPRPGPHVFLRGHDDGVLQKDLALAFELADLAAEVSMKAFGRADLGVETKADGSPVTEVDRIIEGVLREELARYMPDDRVVGEEFGGSLEVAVAGIWTPSTEPWPTSNTKTAGVP